MHIQEEKQEKLVEEFEKIEQERIGYGEHEKLLGSQKRLQKLYLGSVAKIRG